MNGFKGGQWRIERDMRRALNAVLKAQAKSIRGLDGSGA